MLCSHTQNFTIKKTLIKTFAVVYNQISPFLVTKVLRNERQNIVKNVFYQPITETPKRARRKKTAIENLFLLHPNKYNKNKGKCKAFSVTRKRKKQQYRQLQSFLRYTYTQKTIQFDMNKGIDFLLLDNIIVATYFSVTGRIFLKIMRKQARIVFLEEYLRQYFKSEAFSD